MSRCKEFLAFMFLAAVSLGFFISMLLPYQPWRVESVDWTPPRRHHCTDVITKMVQGHWERNNVTEKEKLDMYEFYDQVLKTVGVDYGIQRPDGRCGNVHKSYYRALCRPGGPSPCCYNFHCLNTTSDNCTCSNCYDLRIPLEAELATWRPVDKLCDPRRMAVPELCRLLDKAILYFIGDSLIRHLYGAFVIEVKGTARMSPFCTDKTLFTNKRLCAQPLALDQHLCSGKVKSKVFELRRTEKAKEIHKRILELANTPRSLVVFGVGIDDKYNYSRVQRVIWTPLLTKMRSLRLSSPRLVWTTPHVIGMIKAVPEKYHEELAHVTEYMKQMKQYLDRHHVPVLSSYDVTLGTMSHDGTHYGSAVNRLLARVLLHHIQELQWRHEW